MLSDTRLLLGAILLVGGVMLYQQHQRTKMLARATHNEEVLEWIDYRNHPYSVFVRRKIEVDAP